MRSATGRLVLRLHQADQAPVQGAAAIAAEEYAVVLLLPELPEGCILFVLVHGRIICNDQSTIRELQLPPALCELHFQEV